MKPAQIVLALLLLGGCATGSGPAAKPNPPATAQAPDQRVVIDPALHGIIRVRQIMDALSPYGFLQFQADVENLTGSAITILYQVDWLGNDGKSLGISLEEPPCTLFRHEVHPIVIASPAAAATSFRLTFQPRPR